MVLKQKYDFGCGAAALCIVAFETKLLLYWPEQFLAETMWLGEDRTTSIPLVRAHIPEVIVATMDFVDRKSVLPRQDIRSVTMAGHPPMLEDEFNPLGSLTEENTAQKIMQNWVAARENMETVLYFVASGMAFLDFNWLSIPDRLNTMQGRGMHDQHGAWLGQRKISIPTNTELLSYMKQNTRGVLLTEGLRPRSLTRTLTLAKPNFFNISVVRGVDLGWRSLLGLVNQSPAHMKNFVLNYLNQNLSTLLSNASTVQQDLLHIAPELHDVLQNRLAHLNFACMPDGICIAAAYLGFDPVIITRGHGHSAGAFAHIVPPFMDLLYKNLRENCQALGFYDPAEPDRVFYNDYYVIKTVISGPTLHYLIRRPSKGAESVSDSRRFADPGIGTEGPNIHCPGLPSKHPVFDAGIDIILKTVVRAAPTRAPTPPPVPPAPPLPPVGPPPAPSHVTQVRPQPPGAHQPPMRRRPKSS